MIDAETSFYQLFTDGACSGNPGPGGWGALIRSPEGVESELSGGESLTTNNRMELTAALKGLEAIPLSQKVNIYTDSLYLRDGMSQWILKWKRNNWQEAQSKGIKNLDLWQQLDVKAQQYTLHWHWVKGHAGHAENERVDLLARNAIIKFMVRHTA